jgi:hypothetical protein
MIMLDHKLLTVLIEGFATLGIVHAVIVLALILVLFLDLVHLALLQIGGGRGLCLALLTRQGFNLILAGRQLLLVELVHREVRRLVQLHDTDHSNQADDSSETCGTGTYTRTSSSPS